MRLAAVDPANPWGALLAWPEAGDPAARPRRVPGAWVLLYAGAPACYRTPGARQLITFPETLHRPGVREAAFAALHAIPRGTRRGALRIEKIDGLPVDESPQRDALIDAGFVSDYRGLVKEGFA